MQNKQLVLKTFIANFILRNKRERSYFELINPNKRHKFTNRLNHNWDDIFDMKYLLQVDHKSDFAGDIQRSLSFNDEMLCYVISNYHEYDDKFVAFKDVFPKVYARVFGTVIMNCSADTLFLSTEQVQGRPPVFIGRRTQMNK